MVQNGAVAGLKTEPRQEAFWGLRQAGRLRGKYLLAASHLATSQAADPEANYDWSTQHWKISQSS